MSSIRIGIILILIGIGIPLVSFPFATPSGILAFYPNTKTRITDFEIVISKGELIPGEGYNASQRLATSHFEGRVAIPYKYLMSLGFFIILIGAGKTVLGRYER